MIEIPKRKKSIKNVTFQYTTGCGKIYVTITYTDDKLIHEVFVKNGRAGSCFHAHAESEGRLCSLYLRSGGDVNKLIKHLSDVPCGTSTKELLSCPSCIAEALKDTEILLKELP